MTPLLLKDIKDIKNDEKIKFIRVIVNFVTQIMYKSHNNITLRYINDILCHIDLLK